VLDCGSTGATSFMGLRRYVMEGAQTRIYALLNISSIGLIVTNEIYLDPAMINTRAAINPIANNRDRLLGVKVRINGRHSDLAHDIDVLKAAREVTDATGTKIMMHWTTEPELLNILKAGDILAHPFTRHPGGFVNREGRVHPIVEEALARGLKTDVGHGSHFSYRMARIALDAGIVPDTLGADMHGYNTTVPAPAGTPDSHPDEEHSFLGRSQFSLVSAMTSMLALGLPLDHVVRMVTSNAAKLAGMEDQIGTLQVGRGADISVLDDRRGRWVLEDNEGTKVVTDRMLTPLFCLRDGVRFNANSPSLPLAMAA